MELLSSTLSAAQRLDGAMVAELTALQGAEPLGFVVDQPLGTELIWQRILRSTQGDRMAHEIRRAFAPGRLGRDSLIAIAVFGAILFVFGALGSRVSRAHQCSRCGELLCARCDAIHGGGNACAGCRQLFQPTATTDRELRMTRLDALRQRAMRRDRWAILASFGVPGAAGLLAGRPLRCLFGSFFAILALFALYWRNGVVPDPLVAGATAPLAALCVAMVSLVAYVILVAASLRARRSA
jgi:hypothetical protein